MRYFRSGILTCATLAAIAAPFASRAQDSARAVAGGGILVSGWAGKIDAQEVTAGQVLANSKLAAEGTGFRVTTGPAVTYWNPANKAAGDYTVKSTFTEPKHSRREIPLPRPNSKSLISVAFDSITMRSASMRRFEPSGSINSIRTPAQLAS